MSHDALYQSRGHQIADHLRDRLRAGHWSDRLPPERALAEQMGVARRTIRAALKELETEGLILHRGRLGTRIAPGLTRPETPTGPTRSVGFLFHNRKQQIKLDRHPLVMRVREILEGAHFHLEVHRVGYLQQSRLSASFQELMHHVRHDLWILSAPPPVMEAWFVEHRVPAIIYGMGQPESLLPTFSTDFQAIGRHAAGELLRRGYRDITLFQPKPTNPEDIHTRLGFEAVIASSPEALPGYRHLWHPEDRRGLLRLVERQIRQRKEPKAWFIMRPEFYITLHSYLLYRGVKIPQEVALISRNTTPHLPELYPEPARYVTDAHLLAVRFGRFVLRVLEGHSFESQRLMADFTPGETLPPRAISLG